MHWVPGLGFMGGCVACLRALSTNGCHVLFIIASAALLQKGRTNNIESKLMHELTGSGGRDPHSNLASDRWVGSCSADGWVQICQQQQLSAAAHAAAGWLGAPRRKCSRHLAEGCRQVPGRLGAPRRQHRRGTCGDGESPPPPTPPAAGQAECATPHAGLLLFILFASAPLPAMPCPALSCYCLYNPSTLPSAGWTTCSECSTPLLASCGAWMSLCLPPRSCPLPSLPG